MSLQVNHMPINPGNIIDPAKKAEALPGFATLLTAAGMMPGQTNDAQNAKNLVNVVTQQQSEQQHISLTCEGQDNSVVDNQWLMFNLTQSTSDQTEGTATDHGTADFADKVIANMPVLAEPIVPQAEVKNVLLYAVDSSNYPIVDATIPKLVNIQFEPTVVTTRDVAPILSQPLLEQFGQAMSVVQQVEGLAQLTSSAGLVNSPQLHEIGQPGATPAQTEIVEQVLAVVPEHMPPMTPEILKLLNPLADPEVLPTDNPEKMVVTTNKPDLEILPTLPAKPVKQTISPIDLIVGQTVNGGAAATTPESSGSSQITLQLVMWSAIPSGNLSQVYSENAVLIPLSFGIESDDLRGQSRILSTTKLTFASQQQVVLENTLNSAAQLSAPAKLKQEILKNRDVAVAAKHSASLFQSVIMPQKITWSEQLQKLWVRDYFMSEQQQQALVATVNKGFAENQQVRTLVLNGRTVIQSGGNR